MKRYDIEIVNNINESICIVLSTSYISPLKFLKSIEGELCELLGKESDIIFDFFLCSGNTPERYAKIHFDGKGFNTNSFEYIKVEKGHKLRMLSAKYYRESTKDLDFSFINTIQRKMILKGIPI